MATLTKTLPSYILENICDIIGDTTTGLTGSQINQNLRQANIDVYDTKGMMLAKRKLLYNSLAMVQNTTKCSHQILNFISLVMAPANFIDNAQKFEDWRIRINQQLSFVGYELLPDATFREIKPATTISDVKIRTDNLKKELESRRTHLQIFNYCKEELLQNNYFHAVLEANKGLFQRIRDISGLDRDGQSLIEQVFSDNPIVIINQFQSNSEKNEHRGFKSLLVGLCAMFRNPTAHEPKIDWVINEQDALEILGIISYCHRRLDTAQKIRMI